MIFLCIFLAITLVAVPSEARHLEGYSPACVINRLDVEIVYEIDYAWCYHDAGTLTADQERCHSRGLCLVTQ